MGVQGLWDLLAPVGRRVSVETLAGKRLAIDASIWMIQFMKAMRDERGEMVSNAHLLGFFRRICKLLFLRTKPVFVFDGGTPALKRRTVIARRRQRENAQAKVRKTAEKLLLNQLKKMRLKELAKELENQKMKNDVKGKKVASSEADNAEKNEESTGDFNQEKMDEMLAASLAAEEDGMYDASASTSIDALRGHDRRASTSAGATTVDDVEDEDDEDEEMILPVTSGNVDPAVLAALPPSMQLDLLVQMRERLMAENRQKYQKVKKAPHRFSELQIESYLKTVAFRREIDQVQKAAAGKGVGGLQTSRIASEANKEFIFSSSFTGDKHVLASAGMRKDAESQTQPEVQNSSNLPSTLVNAFTPDNVIASSGSKGPPSGDEVQRDLGNDVQTYRDDRGHMRVSRVRAMGIRMTRDLQRNLDMMKELEQDKTIENVPMSSPNLGVMGVGNIKVVMEKSSEVTGGKSSNIETHDKIKAAADLETSLEISFEDDEQCKPSDNDDDFFARLVAADSVPISSVGDKVSNDNNLDKIKAAAHLGTSLEISFKDDEQCKPSDNDDDFFARLVAADSVPISSVGDKVSIDNNLESLSEDEWEEDNIEVQIHHAKSTTNTPQAQLSNDNETELEWEDGTSNVYEGASSCPIGNMELKSRGSVEEEVALQEAIRRSLDDLKGEANASQKMKESCEVAQLMSEGPLHQEKTGVAKNGSLDGSVSRTILVDGMSESKSLYTVDAPDIMATSCADNSGQDMDLVVDGYCENLIPSDAESPIENGKSLLHEPMEVQINDAVEMMKGPCNKLPEVKCGSSHHTLDSGVGDFASANPLHLTCNNTSQTSVEVPRTWDSHETPGIAVTVEEAKNEPAPSADINKIAGEEGSAQDVDGRQYHSGSKDDEFVNNQITGASLEDELQMLDEEYLFLGDEQRKMERNAASVSSEMFVECQELLQMFGIPYIIAPMEAEAQCAYMELAGLVEGVVTDDSDAFLFGAQSVYKNIFDDRKYVETYSMKDIESELGLTRGTLIRMALLLGSDYTEGVSGIGIVNAIEVVNAFPEEDGLSKFREWIESPDPTILGTFGAKSGSSSKKRGSKFSGSSPNASKNEMDGGTPLSEDYDENEDKESDEIPKITQIFMDKHRNVSKNWHIPPSFPSQAVISAYISPQVDKSTNPCSWGKPDHFALRRLSWEKFGWANQKADEVLIPVLKEYNKRETQLRMEAFYTFNEKFAKIRSKRISQAVKGITGKSIESCDDAKVGGKRSKRKNPETSDSILGEENLASVSKEPRKNKSRKVKLTSEEGQRTEYLHEKETGSHGSVRTSSWGRPKAQAGGKRKRKGTPDIEISDSDNAIDGHETQFQKQEAPDSLRRSSRPKKAAKYAESDDEVDQATHSLQDAAEEERSRDQSSDKDDSIWLSEMGHLTAADLVPNDGLGGDYVVNGGGFCAEEDEQEKETAPLRHDDAPIEADWNHLQTGGGFCAEEDEQEKETAPSQDDRAPIEAHGNHLQTGGGFCADEDDPEREVGVSEVVGDLHLRMGGGFCSDDRDTDDKSQSCALEEAKGTQPEAEDNAGSLNVPSEGGSDRVVGFESSSCGSQQHLEADHDAPSGNVKGRVQVENATPASSPMKALSAMPYLRRKKRRNL